MAVETLGVLEVGVGGTGETVVEGGLAGEAVGVAGGAEGGF